MSTDRKPGHAPASWAAREGRFPPPRTKQWGPKGGELVRTVFTGAFGHGRTVRVTVVGYEHQRKARVAIHEADGRCTVGLELPFDLIEETAGALFAAKREIEVMRLDQRDEHR